MPRTVDLSNIIVRILRILPSASFVFSSYSGIFANYKRIFAYNIAQRVTVCL